MMGLFPEDSFGIEEQDDCPSHRDVLYPSRGSTYCCDGVHLWCVYLPLFSFVFDSSIRYLPLRVFPLRECLCCARDPP